uniref:Putative ovule protein n=1 Tax=Solanum chacoense TaxID=4108 RepID=A0A0V0I5C8_SOLCH
MPLATSNCNGKIWYFTNHDFTTTVIKDTEQQLTLQLHHQSYIHSLFVTLVYAKCNADQRQMLWEDLFQLATGMTSPWVVGGDFNVVLNTEEKIGGLPVSDADHEDFENCISSCNLNEIQFRGNPFTWWNGRANNECIFERLDRILSNQKCRDGLII